MLVKVKDYIKAYGLLQNGDRVVVACSGGPDSLALLHMLYRLKDEEGFSVYAAHVDHMFRGKESAEDAAFVVGFCRQLGLEVYQTAIDVPAFIAETGRSPQDAARCLRYRYLRQVAGKLGAKIATGHHKDDQAETVLINLLRGSGGEGLQGMQSFSDDLIRPFLGVTRHEIEEYCRENDLHPRTDRTNFKVDYRRNRIRIELLPELAQKYNPNIKEALCRTANIIGVEHNFIEAMARQEWKRVCTIGKSGIFIDREKFNNLHLALKRVIIRKSIEKQRDNLSGITFFHVEKLIDMLKNASVGNILHLPGEIAAKCTYSGLELVNMADFTKTSTNFQNVEVAVQGCTAVPELGIEFRTQVTDYQPLTKSKLSAVFDFEELLLPLQVRTRLPGDKFRPFGSGSRKLKEYFIDQKVPRELRDKIPIVCDRNGILWVAGYRQASNGCITKKTKKFLQITIMKQGDNGYD